MQRGDIIVCALNGDHDKPRPAVLVQSNLFNDTHASVTLCPITTHLVEAPLFRLLLAPTQHNGLKQISHAMPIPSSGSAALWGCNRVGPRPV